MECTELRDVLDYWKFNSYELWRMLLYCLNFIYDLAVVGKRHFHMYDCTAICSL